MALNEEQRAYKMGDDVLMQKADFLLKSMQRDAADFASRNVDGTRRNEIDDTNRQFKDLPTDPELLGLMTTATEAKNATALELRKRISTVRSMAETLYGNTGKYKVFNFGELSLLPDTEMYRTAKSVVRVGTNLLAELASEGLAMDMLNEMAALATDLDDNMDKVAEAEENRDISTQERIRVGNRLWALMVKYADIGKSLFEFTDEARYNDYVLTDGTSNSGGGNGPAPTPPPTV